MERERERHRNCQVAFDEPCVAVCNYSTRGTAVPCKFLAVDKDHGEVLAEVPVWTSGGRGERRAAKAVVDRQRAGCVWGG